MEARWQKWEQQGWGQSQKGLGVPPGHLLASSSTGDTPELEDAEPVQPGQGHPAPAPRPRPRDGK